MRSKSLGSSEWQEVALLDITKLDLNKTSPLELESWILSVHSKLSVAEPIALLSYRSSFPPLMSVKMFPS